MNLSRLLTLACTLSVLALGCPKKNTPADAGAPGAGAGAEAGSDGGDANGGDGGASAGGDDVHSVYPIDPNAPANPIAQKLCAGLTEMPEKKRAACCSTTSGIVVTSECTRTLSAAIQYKAVELDEAAVDACGAAFDKTLEGCDWVGPFAPGPPAACEGIVKGLLSFGQRCRSSLECGGVLRCKGVGPTTPGRCSAPSAGGEPCGGTVDTLATYVRQNDVDKQHPECAAGRCIRHRCAAPAQENDDCQVTLDCADGLQCIPTGAPKTRPKKGEHPKAPKTCSRRPLPKEGEACPGGVCTGDLGCVLNKCTARKPGGADCTNDFECRGGCVRADASPTGKCGPRCDIR